MWQDVNPAHRRVILRVGALVTLVGVAGVLWSNRQWFEPKTPPPDYSAYFSIKEPRELLIGKFHSYDDLRTVTGQLSREGYRWQAERLHVQCASECPPYKVDTLVVENYRHLNLEGRLTLELFNDRLFSAVFNPAQPKAYYQRLQQWSPIRLHKLSVSRWEQQSGQLRVASNIIYATSNMGGILGTEPYVSWEDMRLVAQSQGWYEQYGNKTTLTPVRSTEAQD